MTSPESKNLEAISKAIDQHNDNCPFPASEVRMNPFEVERLGWEEIRGLPIVPDSAIGTGRFRIVCSREGEGGEIEEVEAVGTEIETTVPAGPAPTITTSNDCTSSKFIPIPDPPSPIPNPPSATKHRDKAS